MIGGKPLKAKGAEVVYTNHIDAANPDLKPEMLRMQAAGAQAIMPWSVNAGFLSRICNTRGNMGWDVPIVGQTTLGSGQTKALLEKPEYWNKVYSNNFRNVCYAGGKLPAITYQRVGGGGTAAGAEGGPPESGAALQAALLVRPARGQVPAANRPVTAGSDQAMP